MKRITINEDTAITLLEQVVAGKENFVYPRVGSCKYAVNRKPSCLIAQALSKAGVSDYALSQMDKGPDGDSPTILMAVLPSYVEATPSAINVFRAAQEIQDDGFTWGDALKAARERRGSAY